MRIVCISDTHGLHRKMRHSLPKGDILIHCGDTCNIGIESDVRDFVEWFQNLKGFDSKIFCSGNHDWGFYHKKPWLYHYINDENLSQSDCYYLEDSFITITDPEFSRPIKIYGTPWQPDFRNWAFNVPRDKLYLHWEKIPLDTDILISHGPPQGIGDINLEGESCGCSSLRYYIEKIKPILNISGHIHEGYSTHIIGDTTFVNASTANRRYEMINKPIVVDLTEVNGKLIANIVKDDR